jgi:hypothetical protein
MATNPIAFTPLGRVLWACILTPHVAPLIAADTVAIDEMRLLRAIAAVESGATSLSRAMKRVGRNGERSAWQFMPHTWREYTSTPFAQASTNATVAHLTAQMHLRRLRLELETSKVAATPFAIAMVWNAGPSAVIQNTAPASTWKYAERVVNLYEAP